MEKDFNANMAQQSTSTIVDIAKALNISPSTVSRALKGNPNISEQTIKKVKAMAVKMGYRKNAIAASLRNQESKIIGLIVPRIAMAFQSALFTAMQNEISNSGYNVIVCQTNESVEKEKELLNTLFSAQVDGLVVSATMYTEDFSPFQLFIDHNIPVVFYDRVPEDFKATIIRGDDYRGGERVGEHLLSLSVKDIAFINGLLSCNLYRDRERGFRDALRRRGYQLKENRVFNQLLTNDNARLICERLFDKKPYPDAIFCANDTTAIEVHKYVRAKGLKIPEEVKIVGYSNDPSAEIINPGITTVEQFPEKMGAIAGKAILKMIKGKMSPETIENIVVPIDLLTRSSTLK